MIIAVPTEGEGGEDAQIAAHFGRADTYTLFDDETESMQSIPNTSSHRGGSLLPPQLLAEEGVQVLVCMNLGRKALDLFESSGIKVYCKAEGCASNAIDQFKKGGLTQATADTACNRQHNDDAGHECGKH